MDNCGIMGRSNMQTPRGVTGQVHQSAYVHIYLISVKKKTKKNICTRKKYGI